MYDWVGRPEATSPRRRRRRRAGAPRWPTSARLAIFMWKVAGAPPNRTGAPGRITWAMVIPASTSSVWNTVAPDGRDRRDEAHQRHGHDLHRDAGLDAVDQVLAGVLAVAEVAGRGDREDRHRSGDAGRPGPAEELHHLDHPRHAVLGEGPGNDRLAWSWSGSCTGARRPTPAARCRRWSRRPSPGTGCVRGRRRVGRIRRNRWSRQPRLPRAVVQHLEPRRAGHEVDPVATEIGVRLAVPVVQQERRGALCDRPLDDVPWEQDALAAWRRAGRPCRARRRRISGAPDLHADLGQDALRLVDDLGDELVAQDRSGSVASGGR